MNIGSGCSHLSKPLAELEDGFDRSLNALAQCLRERTTSGEFPDLRGKLNAMDAVVLKVRDEAGADHAAITHLLALANRYHTLAERLLTCRQPLTLLSLDRTLQDMAL